MAENTYVWADECDIILKGGITSGVVYPLAITEIAKAFTLRSIGGTSAGAIAAAAAAAAECGRQRRGNLPGEGRDFAKLEQLPGWLGSLTEDGARTRLHGLFKPAPRLAPIFDAFLAVLARGKTTRQRLWMALAVLWRASGSLPWLVLAAGPVLAFLLPWSWRSLAGGVVLIGAFCVAAVAVVLWRSVKLALVEIPANGFGVCSGLRGAEPADSGQPLTEWLAAYLDELSGQAQVRPETPLTFGDLAERKVDLQMMTTCLTLGRPYRLPFRDDEQVRENKRFWWREEDFRKLFPDYVVRWMIGHQRMPASGKPEPEGEEGFLRLPDPCNLPVVVAARMSLSFPILLAAVPLYAFSYEPARDGRARPAPKRETVWFTDGGISSNFPIHFFDAPVPGRPTFGIDLGHAASEAEAGESFPHDNGDSILTEWHHLAVTPLARLASFLGTIFSVAKEWNHDTLSRLPGFRDRIALIRLTDRQGGLNLNMSADLINELSEFGRRVGKRFVRRFGKPAAWPEDSDSLEPLGVKLDWQNHQEIRLRALLSNFSEFGTGLENVLQRLGGSPADYERFLLASAPVTSYRLEGLGFEQQAGLPQTQAQLARAVLHGVRDIARMILESTDAAKYQQKRDIGLTKGAPRPSPELKIRPRI